MNASEINILVLHIFFQYRYMVFGGQQVRDKLVSQGWFAKTGDLRVNLSDQMIGEREYGSLKRTPLKVKMYSRRGR